MKRLIFLLSLLFPCLPALAQEPDDALLQRIVETNLPTSLKASWHQEKKTALLTEVLSSDGVVYVQQPDKFRWEVRQPVQRLNIFNGESPRGRFRLPSFQDFQTQILESEVYTLVMVPVRRDLKQFFSQVSLTVDKATLQIQSALLISPDGDWTKLSFWDMQQNLELAPELFEK